jgi:hypothetical protein
VQDGGAGKHNNPIDPAEWESRAIWGVGPDVVLSIGTGYERLPESPELVPQRLRLRDRFFPRLFRLFEAVLNAQSNWNDHLNRVNEEQRHKYIRINMPLHEEPGLDEVSKIPEMEKASASFLEAYDFLSVTQALFAVSFFFELHGKPQPEPDGAWLICYGAIHCRSPDTRAFMSRLLDEYPTASFCTGEGTSLGLLDDCELCMMCGHYCKRVTFIICHPDQNVSVYLRFNRLRKHRISGFPQAISYFAKQQLLDAHFGRPDHEVMNGERQHQCTYKIGKKRKREGNSDIGLPSPVRKRQRRIPSKYLLRNSDNDQLNEDN